MRRADRLFQIVQYLRGGRLVTAQQLAERLEVSERTIYRDIADLQSTGVPIDGEAGVGYIMREGFDLPPLMFSRDEIVAIVAGARMLKAVGGIEMAKAAEEALVKIEAVLPETERARLGKVAIRAPFRYIPEHVRRALDTIETATEERRVIRFGYEDANNQRTEREIQPLGLWFWTNAWTAVGWCRMREDFRMFRVDRMQHLTVMDEKFRPQKGQTIKDLQDQMVARQEVPEDFDFAAQGF
ncbi:MAG: YafY family protein [Pseudomonadota bacterium]